MDRGVDTQGAAGGEQWRCARCDESIGAYEPIIVVVENGRARRSSRTAELRAGRLASTHYHEACYLLEYGELPAE
jgi:hypothetical protein